MYCKNFTCFTGFFPSNLPNFSAIVNICFKHVSSRFMAPRFLLFCNLNFLYSSICRGVIFESSITPKKGRILLLKITSSLFQERLLTFAYSKYYLAKFLNKIFLSFVNLYSPLKISALTAARAFSASFLLPTFFRIRLPS